MMVPSNGLLSSRSRRSATCKGHVENHEDLMDLDRSGYSSDQVDVYEEKEPASDVDDVDDEQAHHPNISDQEETNHADYGDGNLGDSEDEMPPAKRVKRITYDEAGKEGSGKKSSDPRRTGFVSQVRCL